MTTENVAKPSSSSNQTSESKPDDEADFVVRFKQVPIRVFHKRNINFNCLSIQLEKLLNLNNYASTKSITQVMLDLALLAVNASQLKYLLTNEAHEMRALLICLVIVSICLQVSFEFPTHHHYS